MEEIIVCVVEAAQIETNVSKILDICGIAIDGEKTKLFKRRNNNKRDYFEMDEEENHTADISKMLEFVQMVKAYAKQIQEHINNNIPAPKDTWKEERACFVLRMTLLRDRWYENNQKTYPRSDFVFRIHHLFYLQMLLRLWRRKHIIMEKPESARGIWCGYQDFMNDAFYVDYYDTNEKAKHDIIRNWAPFRVSRALTTLRLLRCQGAIALPCRSLQVLFTEYCNALIDRVAMLATMPVPGNPYEINPGDAIWFKLVGSHSSDTSVVTGDSSYRIYTKEIKRYLKAEDDKFMKENVHDEEEVQIANETAEMRARRLIPIRKRAELDDKLVRLSELKQLRAQILSMDGYGQGEEKQWSFVNVQDTVALNATLSDEDKEEVAKFDYRIAQLEQVIAALQVQLKAAETEYGVSNAVKVASILQTDRANTDLSEAEPKFMKDFLLLIDGVMVWQEEHRQSEFFPIHSVNMNKLTTVISDALVSAIAKCNTEAFLQETTKFIISSSVNFFEREQYRNSYSGGGVFGLMSVVAAMRSEEHTVFKDFPTDTEPLIADRNNDYYFEANNYFAFWWIQQNLSMNPYRTVFFFDIEEEFLSLDRVDLKSPVISRLGDTWVLVEPGKWSKNGCLQCKRVSNELHVAFCAWLFLVAANRWVIHNRETDMMIDITNLRFKDLWDEAFAAV